MSPLVNHERINRALANIVSTILQEWGEDFDNCGSTTFLREDIARGFEPDSCFYIQNVERVAEAEEIDLLGGDPPRTW
jgi:Uma2 family endonuclease